MGTCLADMLYAKAGLAGIRLLEREGVKVIYPREQTCCGQPAFNSGFQEEALEVALHQINCFPKAYPIVVPSGSCGAMMVRHYPELFEGHPLEKKAIEFSLRIFELSEFPHHVLKIRIRFILWGHALRTSFTQKQGWEESVYWKERESK